ncbi:CLUMA_CG003051, isoform A [Clunio marinus]|uniref:CLUMA_CG003051, isoform A n=1 Tax=Clunio marinus TaxID=568069 RepID=A0A1J1HPH5_9DIPT|nr:CLUMA_CG003051, isoform A [Clunio marinus]
MIDSVDELRTILIHQLKVKNNKALLLMINRMEKIHKTFFITDELIKYKQNLLRLLTYHNYNVSN